MPKAIKPEGGDFAKLEPGVYAARIYSVIDLGTHAVTFNGDTKNKRKIRITWEFPTEQKVFDEAKGEQPFVLSKEYTLSLFDTAPLRCDIETWLGRSLTPKELAEGFETSELIGTVGQAQVIHVPSKKDPSVSFPNISALMALPKGMSVPEAINPACVIEIEDWRSEKFEALPEFVRKKISESAEWNQYDQEPKKEYKGKSDDINIADIPFSKEMGNS